MRELFDAYGIPLVPERVAATVDDAVEAARELGFPVVVKTAAAGAHKTETGGIALDLDDEEDVRAAVERIGPPVLVQPMVQGGVELLAGVVEDPVFGPLVAFGPGGVFTELIGEAQFRLAPLSRTDAEDLVLTGKAGRLVPRLPRQAGRRRRCLIDLVLRLARLADDVPEVAELDLNPVIGLPDGCVAVDARVRVAPSSASSAPRPGSACARRLLAASSPRRRPSRPAASCTCRARRRGRPRARDRHRRRARAADVERVVRPLARRDVGVDAIALVAIAGALALREWAAGAVVALMLPGGNALEEAAAGRSRRELTALVARAPRIAHLRRDGDGSNRCRSRTSRSATSSSSAPARSSRSTARSRRRGGPRRVEPDRRAAAGRPPARQPRPQRDGERRRRVRAARDPAGRRERVRGGRPARPRRRSPRRRRSSGSPTATRSSSCR